MAKRLSDLIGAISDGNAVDWDALERAAASPRSRRHLSTLRALARIASAHRTIMPARDMGGPAVNIANQLRPTDQCGTWGPYLIIERIGQGVSADVFRAYDPKLDREVALKLLTPFYSGRDHGDTVISEGRNLARVRHVNVAAVYAADRIGARVGIAMELVEGRSLADQLQSGAVFTPKSTIQIGLQLCRALAAVHDAGMVHRDVKAQNVIIETDGRLVLTDFGTAVDSRPGQLGSMAGTPAYAAPEMFLGGEVSPRSDIYSVGVLLFRLLTGVFPLEGESIGAMRQAHRKSTRRPLAEVRSDLPSPLVAIVDRALSPNPEDRQVSADAMADALEGAQLDVGRPTEARWRRAGWSAAAAVVFIAVSAAMLVNGRRVLEPLPLPGTAAARTTDGVLVASFVNATGERDLDEVITDVVERDLGRSRQIKLVGRARVEDILKLMRQPVDAVLDEELAQQVSIRDGNVRAIVSGRIDRLGGGYTIGAQAIEPHSERALATVHEQASHKDALLPALQRLTEHLRRLLGELPPPPPSEQTIERATTSSLRALRLYSQSYRLGIRNEWEGALDLARQAVVVDPQFASARIWLAWTLYRTGADASEYLATARQAVDLSKDVDDIERFWIRASYYSLARDDAKAEGAYEALLQLKPDHYWAVNNVKFLYQRRNRWQEAIQYQRRMAELRPFDVESNFSAAESLARAGDFNAARVYVNRLRALDLSLGHPISAPALRDALTAPGFAMPLYRQTWVAYFEAAELLSQRNIVGATAEVTRILEALPPNESELRDWLIQKAVRYFLTMGQMKRATVAIELFEDRKSFYGFNRAYAEYAAGDFDGARQDIRESNVVPYIGSAAWLMVTLGIPDVAERYLLGFHIPVEYFVGGSLKLARGDIDGAIPFLEAQLSDAAIMHAAIAHDLADAWRRTGRIDRAIDVLRSAVQFDRGNDAMLLGPLGPEWMPNALLLAELCRTHGCPNLGASVEEDLERLLVAADDDFPLRLQLRRLKAQGPSVSPSK